MTGAALAFAVGFLGFGASSLGSSLILPFRFSAGAASAGAALAFAVGFLAFGASSLGSAVLGGAAASSEAASAGADGHALLGLAEAAVARGSSSSFASRP